MSRSRRKQKPRNWSPCGPSCVFCNPQLMSKVFKLKKLKVDLDPRREA